MDTKIQAPEGGNRQVISVSYHDDLKEVQGDAPLAALLAVPAASSPFDRLEWWQGLVEHCDMFPLIAVIRHGEARAVLPLYRVKRSIEGLANWYNFTLRPIVSAGADGDALLAEMAEDLAGQAPHITLAKLPDENGETTRLAAAFRKAGWLAFRSQCDVNHVLHVNGRSFADYFVTRPGPLRTTLKRKAKKVEVTLETYFNPDSWAAYEAVYAQSWKPEEGSPAFLRQFAQAEGRAGRLRLAIARAGGEPVAAQFWTVEAGTAWIHKLAHTEASKPLSPGTTLSAALFEQVIDRDKVTLIDFGTGDDPYKRDWMEDIRPRYRLEMYRPLWPGNWPAIARAVVRRLVSRPVSG
ncbi:GNAT family N-acetyltransferase [Erythrobacter sp. EC-HK427]|uniref:GNAT family N-acetyltransferase n=1 Tax=Erythrobacter sp. EC-HK427 TaxID=2038396 RepID=UPI0012560901|nr:GNAT family N-acetyltransferase [Erythrobacter sp. EC-HK427]VVT16088.1 Acetyltransferase (GNAT) domain-containing protein [Erythrobacter sp. EC-HK427]